MKALDRITARLMRPDMAQLLTLFLAVLVVVVSFTWPSGGSVANESWFSLAPTRNALLALVAAGYGASQLLVLLHGEPGANGSPAELRLEARLTLAALLLWALLSAPIEVASYAGSYPSIHLAWSTLVTLLTVPAYFGLGLLLRKLAALLRIGWLLPLLVPSAVVALSWVDLRLDASLFNPWTAALTSSPYPVVAGVATLLTVLFLFGPGMRGAGKRVLRGAASGEPGGAPS